MTLVSLAVSPTSIGIADQLLRNVDRKGPTYSFQGGIDYAGTGGLIRSLSGPEINLLELQLVDAGDVLRPGLLHPSGEPSSADASRAVLHVTLHPLYASEAGFYAVENGLTGEFSAMELILGRRADDRFGVPPNELARVRIPMEGEAGFDRVAVRRLQQRYARDMAYILATLREGPRR
ncbi:MAG: hypothetical protein Q7S65_04995 [Nanoarchaeota archaeon]|nr:hypothetical protein [Nanoarchaeota archaeon]